MFVLEIRVACFSIVICLQLWDVGGLVCGCGFIGMFLWGLILANRVGLLYYLGFEFLWLFLGWHVVLKGSLFCVD